MCIKWLGIKVISKYASAFVAKHSHACHATYSTGFFNACSQNGEKRLLALLCLSVGTHGATQALP